VKLLVLPGDGIGPEITAATLAGAAIDAAIDKVLAKPETRTADLGGRLGTRAFGAAVAAAL